MANWILALTYMFISHPKLADVIGVMVVVVEWWECGGVVVMMIMIMITTMGVT